MRSILAPALLLAAFAACEKPAPPAAAQGRGMPDTCCAPGAAEPENTQRVVLRFLKPGDKRTFAITYVGKVEAPAGTKKLRLWVPVPQDSTVQTIKNLSFSREAKVGTEPKYGNRIAYWEVADPAGPVEVAMTFECTRSEIVTDLAQLKEDGKDDASAFEVFRKADRLVVLDSEIGRLSDDVTKGKTGALEKGRAIYDYVLSKMTYDKNHEGWGRGSTKHACDVGKGNCSDFHALFNSLARSQGIASGFEIGLYLPYERKAEEKPGGYHCWAFFRAPGRTWVPVDCSEASRNPARKDYFFGGMTSNRVTLSTGRDLTLVPEQAGEPLNFFIDPYAEADGKPLKATKTWSFKDLD